ncbi:MAG TPA: thiamine phosphate synthase [Gemmatimonadales bacterium]|nr:thiamine phosphate synthase [Gemmatimonadales bacterium]
MRPLPRLHAITDHGVLHDADLGIRAAAIAAAGPAVALHVRDKGGTAAFLARCAERFMSLAGPPEAAVIVNGRPDLARAVGAQGVQLGAGDLRTDDARRVLGNGWIGRSVHSVDQAGEAIADGADYLVLGPIFETATHPDRQPLGLGVLREAAALGCPVVAIGGITVARAESVREAGAWGMAAIRALWEAKDPYAAAMEMVGLWAEPG